MAGSWKGICLTLWVIGMCVNAPLNVGIITYEKYGMDPMKRNLIDMMFSMIALVGGIIFPTISNSLLVLVQFIGPLNQHLALAYAFLNNVKTNVALLCILEIMGTSVLVRKIWKSVPPINEDYFAQFLFLLNILLGSFFGLVMTMGNQKPLQDANLLTDSYIMTSPPINIEVTSLLLALTLFGLIFMVSFLMSGRVMLKIFYRSSADSRTKRRKALRLAQCPRFK